MNSATISKMIISILSEVINEKYQEEGHAIPSLSEDTCLIGRDAVLDSLGLVTLIVNVEQELNSDLGISITIVDERALSQEKSPFRTVESLSDYILLLIKEQMQHA